MAAALLYKPWTKSGIAIAFGCAVVLHFGAIALASHRPVESAMELPDDPGINVSVDPPPPDAPSPEDEIPPPPVVQDSFFVDENPTPPPVVRKSAVKQIQPLVRHESPGTAGPSAKALALQAPRPEYPYEARRQHLTGSGVALLTVDPASGTVIDVSMAQSTGSAVLDNAAINGFRRWRFRAGTAAKIRTPITFTVTGAAY
ncbi:MAG: energy transducer TonB [Chthoniobacterales bacterium]